jgi:hypothetical protein
MPAAVKVPRGHAQEKIALISARGRGLFSRLPAVGLLVLIIGLAFFLVDLLKRRAQSADLFRVDPSQIEIGELPSYVPDRVALEIKALTRIEPRSIFDATLLDDLKAAFLQHPWIRDVRNAHRVLPNRVALELELRAPAAVVDVGAWRVTVDRDGWVLEDHASLAPDGLPKIRGDKKGIPRIPKVGGRFNSQAVEDGLSVVSELKKNSAHPFFRYVDVSVIDVSNVGSLKTSEIVLELSSGTIVEWGSAMTGAMGPLELPTSRKLDNLLLVQDRHPGLQGVARIHAASQNPFPTLSQ